MTIKIRSSTNGTGTATLLGHLSSLQVFFLLGFVLFNYMFLFHVVMSAMISL